MFNGYKHKHLDGSVMYCQFSKKTKQKLNKNKIVISSFLMFMISLVIFFDHVYSTKHEIPFVEGASNTVRQLFLPHRSHSMIALINISCLADFYYSLRVYSLIVY